MSTIVFIRHAETAMAGRFCGHSDPVLNLAGKVQAIRVAKEAAMMRIDRIYSSDLDRAARTAAAIGRRVGLDVQYLPALREIHFGLWEGLNWREIEDQFPDEARRWLLEFPLRSAPGGEPYPAFTARVDAVIAPLLRESANDTTAVVTHCGVMRYVLKRFFDFSDEQAWTLTAPYGAVVVGDSRIRQAGACRVV